MVIRMTICVVINLCGGRDDNLCGDRDDNLCGDLNDNFCRPSKESVLNVCRMNKFPCPVCNKPFSRKDALQRHKTVDCKKPKKRKAKIYTPTTSRIWIDGESTPIARGSEKEKWPCPLCGEKLVFPRTITRHINSGACPARKAQRSVLREGFPLNYRTPSTISRPDEPMRIDVERNTDNPEGREGEYMKYREGVDPAHPYRYKSLHYPFSRFDFVSDPHGIGN